MSLSPLKVSDSAIRRVSRYLRILEALAERGEATTSSGALAGPAGTTVPQVRKDLSHFGSFGRRGVGYPVSELTVRLREILGLARGWRLALVGAGRVGSALLEYDGFRRRGFRIVAVVDADPRLVGRSMNGLVVHHEAELENVLGSERVDIVILAVPAQAAQEIVERVVRAGVRGVLNFTPVRPRVSGELVLNHVDMTVELEALSFVLTHRSGSGDRG